MFLDLFVELDVLNEKMYLEFNGVDGYNDHYNEEQKLVQKAKYCER